MVFNNWLHEPSVEFTGSHAQTERDPNAGSRFLSPRETPGALGHGHSDSLHRVPHRPRGAQCQGQYTESQCINWWNGLSQTIRFFGVKATALRGHQDDFQDHCKS